MALVPAYMLQGRIDVVKEIDLGTNEVEVHYMDERGNKAIVVYKTTKRRV